MKLGGITRLNCANLPSKGHVTAIREISYRENIPPIDKTSRKPIIRNDED